MTTKAAFMTAMGGAAQSLSILPKEFVRSSGNILTATAHGLNTGAGPFKVMNTNADAPSGLVVARRASTFVTGTAVIATDEIVINGKTYTFIATPAADGDVDVGGSDAKSLANLAAAVNLDRDASATTYDEATVSNPGVRADVTDADVLTISAIAAGTAGNAIAVSSVDATLVVDNAVLENGADGTDYFIIRLTDDTFSVATTKALAIAGTAVALADAGTGINTLIQTVEVLADSLEQGALALTNNGARTIPASINIPRFWQTAIDGLADDYE